MTFLYPIWLYLSLIWQHLVKVLLYYGICPKYNSTSVKNTKVQEKNKSRKQDYMILEKKIKLKHINIYG